MLKTLIGLLFVTGGNILEVIDVRCDVPPTLTVRMVKVPEEGALSEEGAEWNIALDDLMSGWNPYE